MNKLFKSFIFIFFGIVLSMLLSCNSNRIEAPTEIEVDIDNQMSWSEVDGAKNYQINFYYVNDETTTSEVTRKTTFSLNELAVGDYEITVVAIAGEKNKKDSLPSEVIYFEKQVETGCVYQLINNNTEYAIAKVGRATGTFVIEDYYRGKAVTQIEKAAFKGSTRVQNITIGGNVTTIGDSAFYNCNKLEAIVIPESVRSIGVNCFQSCRMLKEVVLPNSITELPEFSFAYCRSLTSVTLGNALTSIGESAFQDCSAITEMIIPNTVKTIGEYAFSACTSMEKLTIGSGVEEIADFAFAKCYAESYDSEGAVSSSSGLKEVTFVTPSSLKTIGDQAFRDCKALVSIEIPEGVTTLGIGTFYLDSALESVKIGSTVEKIGYSSFYGTKLLADQKETTEAFYYADNWLIGVNSDTFQTLTEITTATLKDTIVGIADRVFYEAPVLTKVTLPASFKYIGEKAFYHCENLWQFHTLDDSIEKIGDYAFAKCSLTNVKLGVGLKEIGSYAFMDNIQLDNNALSPYTWIPESVTRIGTYAFKNTKLWNSPRNDGDIIYAANWVVGFVEDATLRNVTLELDKTKVAGVSDYAFYNSTTLQSIEGLSNCRYIGRGAFYGCTNLSIVSLSRNLTEIRDFTFYNCTNLMKVTFPRTLTSIGKYAFYKCTYLASLDLSSTNCTSIGMGAFYYDSNITELKLSKDLTEILDYAFYKCESVTELEIPDKVTTIGYKAFFQNTKLEKVTFGSSVETLGEGAFNQCSALTEITLPNSLKSVGKSAFYKCTSVEVLNLGNGIEEIGDYAFFGLSKVTSLNLPKSLISIGNYAFKGLENINVLVIPKSVKIIGQHAFYGCTNMTIYTDAASIQGEWHNRFNTSYRPIFYGCELDEKNNVLSIYVSADTFVNPHAKGVINTPTLNGKKCIGFTDGQTTYQISDLISLEKEGKLTVLYEE